MSALGQKQTCTGQEPMSALPPKADMCGAVGHVAKGKKLAWPSITETSVPCMMH